MTIYNVYMIYGGTNWGNMGHPNGYTSYDYGAVIAEDRSVAREKYSEAKLQAYFLAASPAYLSAVSGPPKAGALVSTDDLTVTSLKSGRTQFLVVRHTDYASKNSTNYSLSLPDTKFGALTVPQTDGTLSLHGRDSKIHVVNYDMFGINLVYSTAEVLTVKKFGGEVVLIVYGGPNEKHELAIDLTAHCTSIQGRGIGTSKKEDHTIFSWDTSIDDRVTKIGPLTIWFVDRQSAYNFWVLDVVDPSTGKAPYVGQSQSSVIIKGGYLMRTAYVYGDLLKINGDINSTTTIQVIAGAPNPLGALVFNREYVDFVQDDNGIVSARLVYNEPHLSIPDLSAQRWLYMDSLPEIQSNYSDAAWVAADLRSSNNTYRNLSTPTSLYSSDYGFHAGTLLYRGHYTSTGGEKNFTIEAQGGQAFGFSVWLEDHFLGSFIGDKSAESKEMTFNLPVGKCRECTVTVVIDNMGYDENWIVGKDDMKSPRGILDYVLNGHSKKDVSWKLTGNLGGEKYADKSRGPLNEGGMWAERHGYHLPFVASDHPGDDAWKPSERSPMEGISSAGVGWFVTTFDLDMPEGYDVPLAIQLPDIRKVSTRGHESYASSASGTYRAQIYVNGWQYGKYVHHLGPQTMYIVPPGIWDYHGKNSIAISLWAMEEGGAHIQDIKLVAGPPVQTGYGSVEVVKAEVWRPRHDVC